MAPMRRLEAIAGGRRRLYCLAAILLLGLGLRVGYAVDPYQPQSPDSRGYARIAASLHQDGAYEQRGDFAAADVQEASNFSPGLPLLVAGVYELRGEPDLRLARLVLALIGSLAVLFSFAIGRRLAGPDAGLIGAGAVAVYPAFLEYQGMLMTEPLAATLLSGSLLAIMRAADRGGAGAWALAGVAMGLMTLVRPEYLFLGALVPLLAFLLGRRGEGTRAGALGAVATALAFVAVLVPWTIHNLVVLDRFVPISTGGGKVLYIGTNLPTDGDAPAIKQEILESRPALRRDVSARHPRRLAATETPWMLLSRSSLEGGGGTEPRLLLSQRFDRADFVYIESVLDAYAERQRPGLASDAALGALGRENLETYATEEPVRFAGMLAQKAYESWRFGPRGVMEGLPWSLLHALIVVCGLLGLGVLALRRRWEAAVLGLLVLAITALGALMIASPRRVIVAIPVLAALAGCFLVWAAAWERKRRGPRPYPSAR
jgi:Dolichyl-phosphate-mannose-protein mannosyltransferase